MTTYEGNEKAVAEAIRWNSGRAPDIVWCIAGDSFPQFWLETDIDTIKWQMDINFWAAAYMAHLILKSWLDPESTSKGTERHLIFTNSTLSFWPFVGYINYSPAKAALRSLHEGLRQEVLLYGENVKLHTVFPGNISSPGYENENKYKPDITLEIDNEDPPQTPDEVAAGAIKGLEKGEEMIVTTFLAQAMRAQTWSSFPKNNWLWDTLLTVVLCVLMPFIRSSYDDKMIKYGKKHGHPSRYTKRRKD